MHVLLTLMHLLCASVMAPEGNRTHVQAPREERPVWVLSEDSLDEAGTDAREALQQLPGLSVRALGDSFSLATLQVRGVASGHTRVFLDDVPLARADGAPVDLSLLPLWHSQEVRVWPAHAPLGYGGGLGGALVVSSKSVGPGAYELKLQGASFERWSADLFAQASGEKTEAAIGLRSESSRGEFPWFDNGLTSYDSGDDKWRLRTNNDARRDTGLLRVQRRVGRCSAGVVAHGHDQEQGVPGPVGRLAQRARYELTSGLGALGLRCEGSRWRASVQANLGWMRSVANDELAEISLQPTVAEREAWSPSLRALGWWRLGDRLDVGLHQEVQRQSFTIEEKLTQGGAATSSRFGTATALAARWRTPWAHIELASRIRLDTMADDDAERRLAPGWQVTLRSGAWRAQGLTLEMGLSTATRFPTLYEVQGDGLFVSAAGDLRDERGSVLSGTARWEALALPDAWRLLAVMSVFATRLDDVIQMRRNSLYTAVAQNVGRADVLGAELALVADLLRHLRVQVAATGLSTEMHSEELALDGKPLPLRPATSVYSRLTGYAASLEGGELAGFLEVAERGGHTYDMAGLARAPAVIEWGGGARIVAGARPLLGTAAKLTLEARLLNAADTPSVDLLGYPRPGRRWAVQIAWREDGL